MQYTPFLCFWQAQTICILSARQFTLCAQKTTLESDCISWYGDTHKTINEVVMAEKESLRKLTLELDQETYDALNDLATRDEISIEDCAYNLLYDGLSAELDDTWDEESSDEDDDDEDERGSCCCDLGTDSRSTDRHSTHTHTHTHT